MPVSAVARLHGISPSPLSQSKQHLAKGGTAANQTDDDVAAAEPLRGALAGARGIAHLAASVPATAGRALRTVPFVSPPSAQGGN